MQFSSGMDRSCSAHSGPVQHDIGKFTATQFFAIARRPKLGVFHSVRILDCTCRLLSAVTPLRVASSTQSNRSFSKCAAGTGMDCGTSSAASVRAAAACSSRTGSQALPECYVIVYNVAKKHNVGTLLRSCTAFGVKEVRWDSALFLSRVASHQQHESMLQHPDAAAENASTGLRWRIWQPFSLVSPP